MTQRGEVVALDFDHTLYEQNHFMPGALEAVGRLREAGHRVWIFSCNDPDYIQQCLDEAGIAVDGIWRGPGKIVGAAYVDDRGVAFRGDWEQSLKDIDELLAARPMTWQGG
jgi:hypothetical protein